MMNVQRRGLLTIMMIYGRNIRKALKEQPGEIVVMNLGTIISTGLYRDWLINLYLDARIKFGNYTRQMIGGMKKRAPQVIEYKRTPQERYAEALRTDPDLAAILYDLFNFFNVQGGNKIISVVENFRGEAEKSIRESLQDITQLGLGEKEAAELLNRRVDESWRDKSKWIAERIVRTEVHGAANKSSLDEAIAVEADLVKVWSTWIDKRTRESHIAADGQVREMHQPFDVDGVPLMTPGDPNYAGMNPESIINCFVGSQKVTFIPENIHKVFRSLYNGEVITIKMSNGAEFTATPNHPILTTRGWVKVGDLTEFDNCVNAKSLNIITGVNPNINNMVEMTFEQLYNTFSSSNKSVRVRGADVNFHGYTPNSDVDIIDVNSFLRDDIDLARQKQSVNKKIFAPSFFAQCLHFFQGLFSFVFCMKFFTLTTDGVVGGHSIKSPLFLRKPRGTDNVCLTGVSFFDFMISQNSVDNVPTCFKYFTKLKNAFQAVFVKIYNFILWHIQLVCIPFLSKHTTMFKHPFFKGVIIDADTLSNFVQRNTGVVKGNTIVEINSFHYSGFVYTLETKAQIYEISSTIAQNCRCTVLFERKPTPNDSMFQL